ncbi:ABC transporter permease [Enemella sp. A6]|uniref:ABC transporter permease n=1 Tax=Enemella sp. A6 TaxID=3440152 RepID=UPI003EBB80CF
MSLHPTTPDVVDEVATGPQNHRAAPENLESAGSVAPASPDTKKKRLGGVLGTIGLRLLIPAIIVAIWWVLSAQETIGLFVASPVDAVVTFYETFVVGDAVVAHLLPSLQRALIGLFLAIVLGITIGVLLGTSAVLRGLFQPLVHLGRSLPSPALLGVFFFLFGTGDTPKIFLIAFSVIWPILLNTIDGVAAVGTTRAQAARVFRIPAHRVLTHIILPGAAPKIFAGIRTSMSFSLILMIISELQKSENGLGYLLIQSQRNFNYSTFFAVLIMLVIIGVVFNLIFLAVERRVLAWHRGATQQHD